MSMAQLAMARDTAGKRIEREARAASDQARVMFSHLPEGELDGSEAVFFSMARGVLDLWIPSKNSLYTLLRGSEAVTRATELQGGRVGILVYRDGEPSDWRVIGGSSWVRRLLERARW